MNTYTINYKHTNVTVYTGSNILEKIDFLLFNPSSFVIVTDQSVEKLYASQIKEQLEHFAPVKTVITLPPGEESKSMESIIHIGRTLAQYDIDKKAILIALGGGIIGDITGFAASIYKRGIRYIQVPTTLLAHVDSSIGGKTGVNIPEGKNLLGTTYQPIAVISDTSFLSTLPQKEISNGLAEVIKYGMILNKNLFEYLEESAEINASFLEHIITESIHIKSSIAVQDENEQELRKVLNYGHTIGHAVEMLSHHMISHGEAVAIGMSYEAKIAHQLGLISSDILDRQQQLIKKYNLPNHFIFNTEESLQLIRNDKKSEGGNIYFVLPRDIGIYKEEHGKVSFPVSKEIIISALK